MSLPKHYVEYLQNPQNVSVLKALCEQLGRHAYKLETFLLKIYAKYGQCTVTIDLRESVWTGHTAHIGPNLPEHTQVGDVWFDTCELMPMILLPTEPPLPDEEYADKVLEQITPFGDWMALRPVANWQYQAFLDLAKFASREVQIEPPFKMIDPDRILQGSENRPVTNLTASEAGMYANWFGKSLSGQDEWQAASSFLSSEAMLSLWGQARQEWGGGFQEGVNVVVTPETYHLDLMDEWDRSIESKQTKGLFYGEWDIPKGVGFRTRVTTQFGLLKEVCNDPTSFDNIELLDMYKRDV